MLINLGDIGFCLVGRTDDFRVIAGFDFIYDNSVNVLSGCPEQSYFSCLKRSGKQEQRHIANSKRVVAVIPLGAIFVLGIKCPSSLVITTLKISSLLDHLHLYFWYFPLSCP